MCAATWKNRILRRSERSGEKHASNWERSNYEEVNQQPAFNNTHATFFCRARSFCCCNYPTLKEINTLGWVSEGERKTGKGGVEKEDTTIPGGRISCQPPFLDPTSCLQSAQLPSQTTVFLWTCSVPSCPPLFPPDLLLIVSGSPPIKRMNVFSDALRGALAPLGCFTALGIVPDRPLVSLFYVASINFHTFLQRHPSISDAHQWAWTRMALTLSWVTCPRSKMHSLVSAFCSFFGRIQSLVCVTITPPKSLQLIFQLHRFLAFKAPYSTCCDSLTIFIWLYRCFAIFHPWIRNPLPSTGQLYISDFSLFSKSHTTNIVSPSSHPELRLLSSQRITHLAKQRHAVDESR